MNKIKEILFLTFLCSIFSGFSVYSEPSDLAVQIDALLNEKDLAHTHIGIYVESLDSDKVWYARNEQESMRPASCNKLLTTAAALDYLGPDFIYSTTFGYTGKLSSHGIIKGDLVVMGSGDPMISGRYNEDDRALILRQWGEALKTMGVKRVKGNLIGNDDYFDDDILGEGWYWEEFSTWYEAPVSALSFDDNCVGIEWNPKGEIGQLAPFKILLEPCYMEFDNQVRIVAPDASARYSSFRLQDERTIKLTGSIKQNSEPKQYWMSVDNPTEYFVFSLYHELEKLGIEISGKPLDIDDLEESKKPGSQINIVTLQQSPPLKEIIRVINHKSQNFIAEQVYKTLGKIKYGEGSFRNGEKAVQSFLESKGISIEGWDMDDGSGLSWMNLVQPAQFVELLKVMAAHKYSQEFKDSLPQGGVRGSLKSRFDKDEEQKRIASRVYAKTGYIYGTFTLCGYTTTDSGENVAFAVILNNHLGGKSIDYIDRIVTLISTSKS